MTEEQLELHERGIKICEIRDRRPRIITDLIYDPQIFKKNEREDLPIIISECVNHLQTAWFFGNVAHGPRYRPNMQLKESGTTFEDLVNAYEEKAAEDLEIADEFEWVREALIEPTDKERRDLLD